MQMLTAGGATEPTSGTRNLEQSDIYVLNMETSARLPSCPSGPTGDITATSANRKCSAVTGEARKIKDNAADWHNLMLRWEKLNDEGFSVAGNIVNMRLTR